MAPEHRKRKLYVRPKQDDTKTLASFFALPSTQEDTEEISEGVDISTLLRLAEDGLL
jgi:hypothetical protein